MKVAICSRPSGVLNSCDDRTAVGFPVSSRFRRTALPLITAAAYLVVATTPCQPNPAANADGVDVEQTVAWHHSAAHDAAGDDGSPSFVAACVCGCDQHASSAGSAKRAEPGLRPASPILPPSARAFDGEIAVRLPDAPISVATPVPIAA